MNKKIIAFICIFCCISLFNNISYAAVSNLSASDINTEKQNYNGKKLLVIGDSIGRGHLLDSVDDSYSKLLADKLNMKYENIAVNGTTSEELLNKLNNNTDIDSLKNADIINISIGGNDIMQPLLALIKEKTNISDDEENIDYGEMIQIYENFYNDMISGKYDDIIKADMELGYESFNNNFPLILEKIKNINKNATIITQTFCNPLLNVNAFSHLSQSIDGYITNVNDKIIKTSENKENIVCVDVYNSLKEESGIYISNINDMDIHPNKYGHYDIYLCMYKKLINEYPDDIDIDIDGTTYNIKYDEDNLSPIIYIKAKDGYRPSLYLDVAYDDKTGMVSLSEDKDGYYKFNLLPHHLYKNIKITGNLVKLPSSKNDSLADNSNNDESIQSDEKFQNIEESDNNTNNNGRNFRTYDNIYFFVCLFCISIFICISHKIKNILRKE